MFSAVDDFDQVKWQLPGWRIEQRYKDKVLIGNWNEERRVFEKGSYYPYRSTHRVDFKNYGSRYLPDVSVRRQGLARDEGIGEKYLFSHHGKAYAYNSISWYDQQFNQRELSESNLPTLRSWDSKKLSWVPEKTDYPLQGHPTNYGLLSKLQEKWRKEAAVESCGDYSTTYGKSYMQHPKENFITRQDKSPPRLLSSRLHPHKVNKDLHLRTPEHKNTPPEYLPPLVSI